MAGPANKKRRMDGKQQRPTKKQRRAHQYNSDSEGEEEEQSFDAVNLLDSDDDIHNAKVDDVADASDDIASSSDEDAPTTKLSKNGTNKKSKPEAKKGASKSKDEDAEEEGDDDDDESDLEDDEYDLGGRDAKRKSKRNDPSAFATSLSKILSTKLSSAKRADPVLARSATAHEASKAVVDGALESRAKRQLREQKRKALEKGRVKDVLLATRDDGAMGEPEITTSDILETERKLRKVAQRGVVRLFNAVRAAQVKAVEADKDTKKSGMIGMKHREEKVSELSKKGFLELIASGGGGLKKGGLEEA